MGIHKNFRKSVLLFLLLAGIAGNSAGQIQLTPVLVGSAGGESTVGSLHLSWSAGEAVVTTISNSSVILTQGFHQPRTGEGIIATAETTDATCLTSNNGTAKITVTNGTAPYTFAWTPMVSTTDSAQNLEPGDYSVLVTDIYGSTDTVNFTIGVNNDQACELHIYSGYTPNADGVNDTWEIDGIAFFPENTVRIFNRWGDRVWEATSYNNNEVIWKGENQSGQPLPEGTYFYIVTLPHTQFTGWVEITR